MNQVQIEDCKNIGNLEFIDWEQFRGTTILVTGSTGLIGKNLVNAIAYNSQVKKLDIKLILPVRNVAVAENYFSWIDADIVHFELGTELILDTPADYIVHLASPTSSKYFTTKPVDTMMANIEGTRALLEWAKIHPVRTFVGVSTMEVYGFPEKGYRVKETDLGTFETMNSRNSYPIAKIACEALCNSYYAQYGVPTVIMRATQTFGPGVKYDDSRVFAQFMRCVVEKKDIVLKSAGLTERPYLYTADAVSAILVGLLKAKPGEAYTVANPETYCSIKEMAKLIAEDLSNGEINVRYDIASDIEMLGYAKTLYMDLDIAKIQSLGWHATVGLRESFERMIRGLSNE